MDQLKWFAEFLYGDISKEELPRIIWLSTALSSIIGGFWMLDSLKDTIFSTMVGLEYQPKAKIFSVFVTLILVLIYNKVINKIQKIKLFIIIGLSYSIIFLFLGLCLSNKTIGMANTTASPWRIIGWVCYFSIESYGSLTVALFWAFCNSNIDLSGAKRSYGLIIAMAQIGSILGSTLATQVVKYHIGTLFHWGSMSCLLMVIIIYSYATFYPDQKVIIEPNNNINISDEEEENEENNIHEEEVSSFTDGLILVFKYRYVTLLFLISCLYEIVLTVLDYELKIFGRSRYGPSEKDAEKFGSLMGHFGQLTNIFTFFFSLIGTSIIVRYLGLSKTLRLYPSLLILAVLFATLFPNIWVIFIFMALLKGLSYSLNEPAKEMLYMPTTNIIKYKAKGWIDVFGARSAKAIGSMITNATNGSTLTLISIGNLPALLVAIFLLVISVMIGREFEKLIANDEIVGIDSMKEIDFDKIEMISMKTETWNEKKKKLFK